MTDLAPFYVHTLTVETYTGQNSETGPVYAASQDVPGFLDTDALLVSAGDGQESTSAGSRFYCDPSYASVFTVQSRCSSADLGGDGLATVTRVNVLTSGALGLPDHVEVSLS